MPDRAIERVPVLIVGAGYAGLSAAAMLAWRGIRPVVVERHPSTSIQPKAFGVNPRALEMLRLLPGFESKLAEIWSGIGDGMRIGITGNLADPNRHMIVDGNDDLAHFAEITPVPDLGAPQSQVERLLRAKAEAHGADLRFSTELIALEQDAGGVDVRLRDVRTGERRSLRADYVVAADGWRSPLRAMLGVPTSGKGELGRTFSILFDADLSGLVNDREVTLWYLRNDVFTGALVTGTGVGVHVLGVNYDPAKGESEEDFTEERCRELVRIATGRPDLPVKVLDRNAFGVAHVLADRYREGRVFFAGDAAHTMPPTGGQGGSIALIDGCDIAWRLWLVLTGQAGEGFLDTYDAERRPAATLMADIQLANLAMRMPPAARVDYPEPVEDMTPAIIGYLYRSSAVLTEPGDDGAPVEDPLHPTGRPGSRAPHVNLSRDGRALSTIDLFGDGFVLLTGDDAWTDAARTVAWNLSLRLTPYRIADGGAVPGPDGVEVLRDPRGEWTARYGVTTAGAVLVRPDGHIAWRSPGAVPDPSATLTEVLTRILSRS